ncbi:Pyridinium-3,5-bisthiocarboxylic acid mononucleotide synthase [Labrys miyagiensis]
MTRTLDEILSSLDRMAVAVSGGVDSVTLATLATRLRGAGKVRIMHAVSPAVPGEATERVQELARQEGWDLQLLDAGEFADENYLSNPVNRCFFCKGNLYGAIAARSDRQILSGTNTDDLGEYRPGLDAARNFGVRHPFVEAGISKADVRRLARGAGLGDIAELPASPCLSSRVETSISIDPLVLQAVHRVERLLDDTLKPSTVRCRVRRAGVVIELDQQALSLARRQAALAEQIQALLPPHLREQAIAFEAYRNGSAFVGARP